MRRQMVTTMYNNEHNLSPMILIGNQMALGIISLAFYANSRPFLIGQVDY